MKHDDQNKIKQLFAGRDILRSERIPPKIFAILSLSIKESKFFSRNNL